MKTIAFFNNRSGVGKTFLAYHLAWMYALQGYRVLIVDFDPQAKLTAMLIEEDRLEQLWSETRHTQTVVGAIRPLLENKSNLQKLHIQSVKPLEGTSDNLGLIAGDLGLSLFEASLSNQWSLCSSGNKDAFKVVSAFHKMIEQAAQDCQAEIVLIDLGPNLGAINRTAMVAADFFIVPLIPDLFSWQSLRTLGPTLRDWRKEWQQVLTKNSAADLTLGNKMQPAGYILLQQPIRLDRPVQDFGRWLAKIPSEYARSVLGETEKATLNFENDSNYLATLKNYRSLIPLAMEAQKPMFLLKSADGAIGSYYQAVQDSYRDFEKLARQILERTGILVPQKI